MVNKSAKELWQDYSFLTKEMRKFLEQDSMELFYELVDQRERLQTMIAEAPDKGFASSPEGRKLYQELKEHNEAIQHILQVKYFQAKQNRKVSETYTDGLSNPTLNRINIQR